MKETAVEWLVDNLHYLHSSKWDDIVEQAKEIEKEQIKDSFLKGYVDDLHQPLPDDYYDYNAEQYYNETFNKKT